MSELIVYSASAGSGKTYTLAREYILQVISKPNDYRAILAVTFTNKATEEMKSRIIEELHDLAVYEKQKTSKEPSYLKFLKTELAGKLQYAASQNGRTVETEISDRARKVLTSILHDYSNFAISTIDKFFQRVVRNFVNELNIQPGYILELDTDRILTLAVDRVLEGLFEDETLQQWVFDLVEERLNAGDNWELFDVLSGLGKQLMREDFRQLSPDFFEKIGDKEFLKSYYKGLLDADRQIDEQYKKAGVQALAYLRDQGIALEDIPGKSRSFATIFEKAAKGIIPSSYKTATDAYNNPEKWMGAKFPKMTDAVYRQLNPILGDIIRHIEVECNRYKVVIRNFRSLGVLADIDRQMRQLANDDNLLLISDTNVLVNRLIADTDAPFIYEKMGNRYSSYLIDEFQDTSKIQYENFRPLLENCIAQGGYGLVVGDVKQSIYRWRNGDWETLGKHILQNFDPHRVSLDTNYRSKRNVIEFNNGIFPVLVDAIQNEYAEDLDGVIPSINLHEVYQDILQKTPNEESKQGGYVYLESYEGDENEDSQAREAVILHKMVSQIVELQRERGYRASDIAILVRRQKEGQKVAEALLAARKEAPVSERKYYNFISQGALYLTSSSAINLIIAVLRMVVQDQKAINSALISFIEKQTNEQLAQHGWFETRPNERLLSLISRIASMPLTEAVETIISEYALNKDVAELPFLGDFCDIVLSFAERKISDIRSFIGWWDEKGYRAELYIPGREEAITILTVHKSKGLQYGVVIIPFCNWDIEPSIGHNKTMLWVDGEKVRVGDQFLERVPVVYGKDLKSSQFAADAANEQGQSYIDNINLAYVALTRAEKELYIYIPKISRGKSIGTYIFDAAASLPATSSKKNDELSTVITFGDQGFGVDNPEKSVANTINLDSFRIGKPLSKIKQDYLTSVASGSANLTKGLVMHRLFSHIKGVDDIEEALLLLLDEGWLLPQDLDKTRTVIKEKMRNKTVAEWFSSSYEVITEGDIILPGNDFRVRRPDRVMKTHNRTVVVDFKFGEVEDKGHQYQVFGYVNTLKKMGFPNVVGYLWYFDSNKVVELE